MSFIHQNQNLFLRTVFKYSFLFVPSSVIAAVCFVLSQREVAATLETFSVFNILAAAAILYIVLSSNESRSFSQYSLTLFQLKLGCLSPKIIINNFPQVFAMQN